MNNKVLLIDDDPQALILGERLLLQTLLNLQIFVAPNSYQATELILKEKPEVVVLDLCLEPCLGVQSGFDLLSKCLEIDSTMRVIVMTGYSEDEYGIRAIRSGAASFLGKPFSYQHLGVLIQDGIQQSKLKRAYQATVDSQKFKLARKIIGSSGFNQELTEALNFASKNNQPVLITGETGTGKGFCAELIHQFSKRAEQKFIRMQPIFSNADIVASELFGHQKGSFTGAILSRPGLFQEAHLGTLFLDEIDAFPQEIQVSLLGVLQNKKFRPIGANQEQASDFRLISASNQSLEILLEQNKFRSDLYFRIAGLQIKLAPLRERKDDLADLAEAFCGEGFCLSTKALDKLINYDWPGNIRELENVINNAVSVLEDAGRREILPNDLRLGFASKGPKVMNFQEKVQQFKSRLVRDALLQNSNSQTKAAQILGIDRATLRKIISD